MTDDELDDVRKLVVAFEDAATWCEGLASLSVELLLSIQQQRSLPGRRLSEGENQIARTLRHLEADRRAVRTLRDRLGLPAPPGDPQLS
jgi:hypothetical protein